MSLLANPIVLCGSVALGIVLLLVIVVVICCKKGVLSEREELMEISEQIDSNNISEIEDSEDKLEQVLNKMQESLDAKEELSVSFEEEQEEKAIISYQELLDSLGAKSSIDVDSIEVFEDELENQIEISAVNKEIIDAYQKENLDREIFRFQNDYSNEGLMSEVVRDVPTFEDYHEAAAYVPEHQKEEVVELSNNVADRKFKKSEFISPVYGIMSGKSEVTLDTKDDVEEIIFEDDSLLDEF